MTTDYGTDVACLTDLPDPEALVDGPANVAYAVARRWLQPMGILGLVGDDTPYSSFDIRDYLGARVTSDLAPTIERLCISTASEEPRVGTITVAVSFLMGKLRVAATGTTADGPFDFVLTVDGVTAVLLFG